MLFDVFLIFIGLAFLYFGGEALVRGAESLATRLGMPSFLIGLIVVGFGTSTPELMVSLEAVLLGAPDIAIGNVVGSNTANILLILGISALIAPIAMRAIDLRRDLAAMVMVAVALLGLGFIGTIDRFAGIAMLLALSGYVLFAAFSDRKNHLADSNAAPPMRAWKEAAAIVFGLGLLLIGADFLVEASTRTARILGVSEAVIGLTIVALGTSLPELAASVAAALRRNPEIALGNVIGSNIFNIFGILGLTAIVSPLPIAPQFATYDIPLMLAVSLALAALYWIWGKLTRGTALAFLLAYAGYIIFLF